MELNFKDLVKESREKTGFAPLKLDLGDGRKPIVLQDVPTRLFTEDIEFGRDAGDTPRVAMELLERMFTKKEWERVNAVLQDAPVGAVGSLMVKIFDHFGLVFGESEAGKDSEGSEA